MESILVVSCSASLHNPHLGSHSAAGRRARASGSLAPELSVRIFAPMDPHSRPTASVARLLPAVWLVTAGWDFLCATALSVVAYHRPAAGVWKGVAATVLGPRALDGGVPAAAVGIALHLAVALVWSALFVAATLRWPALRRTIQSRGGALAVAAAYGPLIWLVMSLVVIPLATHRPPAVGFRWWVQIVAHVPFVAIPLVFTTRHVMRGAASPTLTRPAMSAA